MKTLKKKLAVVLSLVMAICMLAPMAAVTADAAETEAAAAVVKSAVFQENEDGTLKIVAQVTSPGALKAEVKVGTKTKKEDLTLTAGDAVEVKLATDYLKSGKAATIKLGDAVLTVNAKAKTKVTFDGVNETFVVEADKKTVTDSAIIMVKEKAETSAVTVDKVDVKKYYVEKTATYEVYVAGGLSEDGKTYTPDSKVAKVKVAKQKNAPKITVDSKNFTIKVPAKHEYVFVSAGKEVTGAAVKTQKVSIIDLASEAGISLVNADEKVATVASILVKKSAAGKVVESATATVDIKPQRVASKGAISYTYKLNGNKQKGVGIIVENTSKDVIYEVAVNAKGEEFTDAELAATGKTAIKWVTVKPGKKAVIKAAKAVSGAAIAYRTKFVKGTKKVEYAFPSTIEMCDEKVLYPNPPAKVIELEFAKTASYGALTVSGTAVKAVAPADYENVSLVYAVGKKNVKIVAIGAKTTDEKFPETKKFEDGYKIEVKAGQFVTVYAVDKDNNVVAFGCKKVTKADRF